jgi:hypothetical protein
MSKLLAFRILLIAFVVLYVFAMSMSGLPVDAAPEVIKYDEWARAQLANNSGVWGLSCAVGHIFDIAGLILLFVRRRMGVYFLIAGAVMCLGAGGGQPSLQVSLSGSLLAFANIAWGAIMAMAFVVPDELFKVNAASGPSNTTGSRLGK